MPQTLKDRVEECERRRPSISRADIARAAGVKRPSVTDWFNGKTTRLKLRPAVKAARLWGCNPLWLSEGEEQPGWLDADAHPTPPTPELAAALPVVLDAIAACPERAELERLLPLLVTGAPAYRQRVAELLGGPPAAPRVTGPLRT